MVGEKQYVKIVVDLVFAVMEELSITARIAEVLEYVLMTRTKMFVRFVKGRLYATIAAAGAHVRNAMEDQFACMAGAGFNAENVEVLQYVFTIYLRCVVSIVETRKFAVICDKGRSVKNVMEIITVSTIIVKPNAVLVGVEDFALTVA